MKVRLSDISEKGLSLKNNMSFEKLNTRMNEGKNNDIEFVKDPEFDLLLKPNLRGISLTGTLTGEYKQPCSLCLKGLTEKLDVNIEFMLQAKGAVQFPEDDVGVIFYDGEHIDLEDVLQECLILKLTPYLRPDTDENEKCKRCGLNTATMFVEEKKGTITLGNLLKNAGVK